MKDVYVYKENNWDSIMNQLQGTEAYDIKPVKLNDWDLNTLVYIIEMDISHMESDLLKHPSDPSERLLMRERELLNKIKGLMED